MKFSWYIARQWRHSPKASFSRTVTRVGLWTVALGLTLLLSAFAILLGFKDAIFYKIQHSAGDARITRISENHASNEAPFGRKPEWEKSVLALPYVDHIQWELQKPGILVGDNNLAGVLIKGIGREVPASYLQENNPSQQALYPEAKEILISQNLANYLQVAPKKSLILYFLDQAQRPRKVRVKAINQTGWDDLDRIMVLSDRQWMQDMMGMKADSISAYQVFFKDGVDPMMAQKDLEMRLPMEWKSSSIYERFPAIFDWMMMLDRNILIFVVLLMVVAAFNLVATLWVLMMERIPMIGLLKALGAQPKQIRWIFWWNGYFITLRGMILGNAIAAFLCFLQDRYQWIPLNPENYYMNAVPIAWYGDVWLMVNLGTLALIAIVLYLPTLYIDRIAAVDALKFKQ